MKYRDLIREMKSSGHYRDAAALETSLRRGYQSEYDSVYSRSDARDGLSIMSHSGDVAEQAYDNLKYAERREEQRREEQEMEQRREENERHRRQEEAYHEAQREAYEMELAQREAEEIASQEVQP